MRKLRTAVALLNVCLLMVMAMGAFQTSAAEHRFPDMAGHWAQEYVNALATDGVISGMPDGNFHPGDEVTTCQFVAMLLRGYFGGIAPTGGHWASGYMDKALELEVISELDAVNVDDPLPRRYAARIGYDALVNILGEPDEADVSAAEVLVDLYACRSCVGYISQFYTKGIMVGYPDSNFYGQYTLTRAEAAVIVAKILNPSLRNPQVAPGTPK